MRRKNIISEKCILNHCQLIVKPCNDLIINVKPSLHPCPLPLKTCHKNRPSDHHRAALCADTISYQKMERKYFQKKISTNSCGIEAMFGLMVMHSSLPLTFFPHPHPSFSHPFSHVPLFLMPLPGPFLNGNGGEVMGGGSIPFPSTARDFCFPLYDTPRCNPTLLLLGWFPLEFPGSSQSLG